MTRTSTPSTRPLSRSNIVLHDEQPLLERPHRATDPVEIVMLPEQLHQRNYKRALAERRQPRSSVQFRTPIDVATRLLTTHEERPFDVLDRLDRLRLLQSLLEVPDDGIAALTSVYGTDLTEHAESIETAREELQILTGGNDARYDALRDVCGPLSDVATADVRDLCTGVRALGDALEERVAAYPDESAVFRACATALRETDGAVWENAFPTIDRISLAGVSTLGEPILDFFAAIETATSAKVQYFLRAGTGPRIARRVAARHESDPVSESVGSSEFDGRIRPEQPPRTTEIAVQTRHDEARTAAAIVDGVLEAGGAVDDIALVARDVDSYERPVRRALSSYGRSPAVWTQLPLTRTLPYRLVVAVCEVLGEAAAGKIDGERLLAPLELQWTNPSGGGHQPLEPSEIYTLRRSFGEESRSRVEWLTTLNELEMAEPAPKRAAVGLLNWVGQQSDEPTPDDVLAVLEPIVDVFDDRVLPERAAASGPGETEIEQTARAIERIAGADDDEHLLRETRAKYVEWLDRGHVEQSWTTVLEVLDALATARPGRREHAAERIDVLDATDTWLRTYPFVVAMGFVDGEWPQRPHGALPSELRAAIVEGATAQARQFPVRGAWSNARDYDHFADAVRAATDHLVVTRYTEDVDGVSYDRSPLLDALSTDRLSTETVDRLQAGDPTGLPNDWLAIVGEDPRAGDDR